MNLVSATSVHVTAIQSFIFYASFQRWSKTTALTVDHGAILTLFTIYTGQDKGLCQSLWLHLVSQHLPQFTSCWHRLNETTLYKHPDGY